MNKIVLRWVDTKGKKHRKLYDDWREAHKAQKWLVDNGCTDSDIAVVKIDQE